MASNLTRFDPFGDIVRAEPFHHIEDLFKDFRMFPTLRGLESESRIRMDVSETDDGYLVKAEMPGVKKEDIKVSINGNQVSISAEVKEEKEDKKNGVVVRSERYYGHQHRTFTLAQEVDDASAEARYQDGVLELSLPKKPETGGRQLAIH